ncbi:MAG: DUF58 domain-containing protein [Pseudomonadales bacterium]|jgi:uncharacterized protein (DUF58 family)|nr:DUF58 domain-containing protein [Pseudomonadales bacterium]MDP6317098.1 DUF58 domain-containing protein [Pseudomonadales bacterium]MDP7316149.1 DUF58 domain-containing protein [Pseudomonadales bacterium]MDP7576516.1 DUF58 domain-containing protein [Pseudomonadales bacterium]HJP50830.1 DUF58 domain-containing protein [Pseudomonadales bacterium]|tara:strand:- start:5684 stop:6652 length:969 start_codon:yes stop_codon:yes gene_type:complete
MRRYSAHRIRHQFSTKGGAYTDVAELIRFRHAVTEIDSVTINRSSNPLSGLLTSKFLGRGIDFAEVRVYEPGDDIRTIDWRVTARTQTPHTKLFQEEKERPVLILVDQSHSMFFGSQAAFKSVIAAQAAALIAWVSLDNGDRVGGIVFSDATHREVRPRRSKHAVLRLLHEINDFNHLLNIQTFEPNTSYLSDALVNVRRVAKHGSTIFLISDFRHMNTDAWLHFRQLSRHNDIIGIHVSDPMERELPRPDLYTITDGQQRTQINTADSGHRINYHQHYLEHLEVIRTEFTKTKSPLFEVSTEDKLISTLAEAYEKFRMVNR